MSERQQNPLKKFVDEGAVFPFQIVEGLCVIKGAGGMFFYLIDYLAILTNEHDFVHIPEASVVEVGGAQSKNRIVDEHQFGVEVVYLIKQEVNSFFTEWSQVFVSEDVDEGNVGLFGENHIYLYPTLGGIHQGFAQQKSGQKIGRFNHYLFPRIFYHANKFVVDSFESHGRSIAQDFKILKFNGGSSSLRVDVVLVETFEILFEQLHKLRGDVAFHSQYRFAPIEVVARDI